MNHTDLTSITHELALASIRGTSALLVSPPGVGWVAESVVSPLPVPLAPGAGAGVREPLGVEDEVTSC